MLMLEILKKGEGLEFQLFLILIIAFLEIKCQTEYFYKSETSLGC